MVQWWYSRSTTWYSSGTVEVQSRYSSKYGRGTTVTVYYGVSTSSIHEPYSVRINAALESQCNVHRYMGGCDVFM